MGGLYSRPKASSLQTAKSTTTILSSKSTPLHLQDAFPKAAPSGVASPKAETASQSPGLLSSTAKRSREDLGNGNERSTTFKKPKTTTSDSNLLESRFDNDSYRDVVTDASLCHGRFTVCNLRGNPSPLFQQQQQGQLHNKESFYYPNRTIDISNDNEENEIISNADESSSNGLSSSAWRTCESWSSDKDESLVDDLELLSHLDFVLE